MTLRGVRRARGSVAVGVVLTGLGLAACGTATLDPAGPERLVRNSVASAGNVKLKSVSCPNDVTPKAGATFDCKLTVIAPDGSVHSGTVTIHQADGNGHIQVGSSDFHVQ